MIQAWLRKLQHDLAATYVRTVFTNVSAVFNAAVDDGLITSNPCRAGSVKLPKREQRRVEPWPRGAGRGRRSTPFPSGTGRRSRRRRLRAPAGRDVRAAGVRHRLPSPPAPRRAAGQDHQRALVLDRPKGDKTRTVPLPDAVATELAEHLRRHPADGSDLVFTSREHKPINRNHFNGYVWKPALGAAGVEPSRANGMHALRHFYASVLIDAGESVRAVADYLGHADPGFTLRVYAHLFPSSENRAREAVDRLFRSTVSDGVTPPAYDDAVLRRPR